MESTRSALTRTSPRCCAISRAWLCTGGCASRPGPTRAAASRRAASSSCRAPGSSSTRCTSRACRTRSRCRPPSTVPLRRSGPRSWTNTRPSTSRPWAVAPSNRIAFIYWQHRFVRLYNTFTRQKEELRPLHEGIVRIYSCGPTVYRYVHVGNLRTFMLPDLLRRSLEYLGYKTQQAMNITDGGYLTDDTFDRGEDKMLVSARLENKTPAEIAAYYTEAFTEDAAKLNIRRAANYPRATDHIPQMIELITKLIARGHAYEVGGTVYYDIASFPAYGKLSRNTTGKLLAGAPGEGA